MKYIMLLGYFLFAVVQAESIYITDNEDKQVPVENKASHAVSKNIQINWDENLSVTLDSNGLKSSEGIRILGSFDLKGEDFRSISLRGTEIIFPKHNILLVRKDYSIYILDLKKEKRIGHFKIPSRGTPRTLEIQRDNYNFTKIETRFRRLPTRKNDTKVKSNRPGPLIKQVMVYREGKYIHEKRSGH